MVKLIIENRNITFSKERKEETNFLLKVFTVPVNQQNVNKTLIPESFFKTLQAVRHADIIPGV